MKIIVNADIDKDLLHGEEKLWKETTSIFTTAEIEKLPYELYNTRIVSDIWANGKFLASYKIQEYRNYVEFDTMQEFFAWAIKATQDGTVTLYPSKLNAGYGECEW